MPLKRLKPEMRRLPKPQQYFLCPSPMLSLAHLLRFLSADQLSCLSSPEDIYAECVHSSQVYMLPSPPGGRFTLSTSLSLSLSVSPPPPATPPLNSHPSQPIPKLLGKGLGLAQQFSLPGPINHRLEGRLVLYTRG